MQNNHDLHPHSVSQLLRSQTRRYLFHDCRAGLGAMGLAVLWALIVCIPQTVAADDDAASKPITLNICVVDEQGHAVADAYLGLMLLFDPTDVASELPADEAGWRYGRAARSDGQGNAAIFLEKGLWILNYRGVIARHPARGLIGISIVNPDEQGERPIVVTLHPACRVTGKIACRQRTERGLSLSYSRAALFQSDHMLLVASKPDHAFELWAPPGEYLVSCDGELTLFSKKTLRILPDDREIDLGEINLAACKYGLMQGEPAPELRDIVAWQNSEPRTMSDLRGRWVLLEFWGHWCGHCLQAFPYLNRLHEEYGTTNLTIIGLHADNPGKIGENDSNYQAIESPEAVQQRLDSLRKNGPDFCRNLVDPKYPIAFERVQHVRRSDELEDEAISAMSAEYGIVAYPTGILIDPEGRVVEHLDVRSLEDYRRLEAYLNPPADALSPISAKAQP